MNATTVIVEIIEHQTSICKEEKNMMFYLIKAIRTSRLAKIVPEQSGLQDLEEICMNHPFTFVRYIL